MKHRLTPLLEGMEMGKSEHDWLEQRLENMTAKEELLFRDDHPNSPGIGSLPAPLWSRGRCATGTIRHGAYSHPHTRGTGLP